MSYELRVLNDNPLAFLPMDIVISSNVSSYQDLLNNYPDYSNVVSSFIDYKTISDNIVPDHSGCGNDGYLMGSVSYSGVPLVYGFSNSTRIDNNDYIVLPISNNYYGSIDYSAFGTLDSSDNDFSLELWVYPEIASSNLVTLFGDSSNGVGIFYDKGTIIFKLDTESVRYTIPYIDKAIHIVATYTGAEANIYINGKLESTKQLSNFAFTNNTVTLSSGPVPNTTDFFLVNCMALYRYALSETTIKDHYDFAQSIQPISIVSPDNGELFEFYDDALSTQYSYSFPADKSWEDFLTDDLYYDTVNNSIELAKGAGTSKTVIIDHFITIPTGPLMDDSRIEWNGNNGVLVQTSLDGINYTTCTNGDTIPGYGIASFSSSRNLHIRITLSTTNDLLYIPKLYTLSMSFYNNQIMYAQNSGSYFSKLEGVSGVSVFDANLSNKKYPILSRDRRNGLRTLTGSGFFINTNSSIQTMEFFYTPLEIAANGSLINSAGGGGYSPVNFSWSSGTISKTNITGVYINGVNKTSETNINNLFSLDELCHVVLTFGGAISGAIKMNYSSSGSISALYQNLALYPSEFNLSKALEHYNLYVGQSPTTISNTLMSVTENSFEYYNSDWTVRENV